MAKNKAQEPCFNIITNAYQEDFPSCCGIDVLGSFRSAKSARHTGYDYSVSPPVQRPLTPLATLQKAEQKLLGLNKLILATTTPDQKDAIQALKAVGFKKVTTTPSNEGRYSITLWMYKRPRRKNARTTV